MKGRAKSEENISISGIPVVENGGKGGRAHSLDEWVDMEKSGGVKGMSVGLAAILAVAGVD